MSNLRRNVAALLACVSAAALGLVPDIAEARVGDKGCTEHSQPGAGIAGSNDEFDYQVELEPGADTEHYADWLLGEVGIAEEDRAERHIYTYCRAPYGLWLRLKTDEVADMNRLTGQRPEQVLGGSVATRIDVPEVLTPDDAVADYTLASPQHVPASRERTGWEPPSGNRGATVAILDTGVDVFHPDLNIDARGGFDCTMEYPDRWQHDFHGHGTAMASVAGALDNNIGTVGFDPAVPIIPIPVLSAEGYGSSASVACGIDQALKFDATVANLSLGGTHMPNQCGAGDPYTNTFCYAAEAGLYIVVSAGNDTLDTWNKGPANVEPVITVAASSANLPPLPGCAAGTPPNSLATFSNHGVGVDITSPSGVCEYVAIPGGLYAWMSGTSPAAPGVAGTISATIRGNPPECSDDVGEAWKWVRAWSTNWMSNRGGSGEGDYGGWRGPVEDMPPLLRFGPPLVVEGVGDDATCKLEVEL